MSTVSNAQAEMGYIKANRRIGCINCHHAEERIETLAPRWWCVKGGFWTTALAVCRKHTPKDGGAPEAAES